MPIKLPDMKKPAAAVLALLILGGFCLFPCGGAAVADTHAGQVGLSSAGAGAHHCHDGGKAGQLFENAASPCPHCSLSSPAIPKDSRDLAHAAAAVPAEDTCGTFYPNLFAAGPLNLDAPPPGDCRPIYKVNSIYLI